MLKPIADRVILKVKEDKEETVGGIVLASSAQDKPQVGEVIAVGQGARTRDGQRLPLTVKVGDNVYYDKYAGTTLKYENEDYLVLKENDILAIID
ncbi:co-chaperone GroES [Holzapfeliella sp. JNUCC 72]